MPRIVRVAVVFAVLLFVTACAVPHHRVPLYYDASNPLKTVAVLPMKNDTTDVDGPNVVRKKMIEALEDKSYIVKDVKETDQILRDQMGINLGGQLDMTTPQKLGEVLGVEGVLYGDLMDFDETTTGLVNVRKVRAKFELVNTQTGQSFWTRGLGVRSETRMSGRSGTIASAVARGSDSRDKDVPWVTIDSVAMNERNVGQAFAIGLGAKLLTKAIGIHLDYESKELVRRVTETLPWGPGTGAAASTPPVAPAPRLSEPKVNMPEVPAFAYIDYGRRNFSAVLTSVSVDKGSKETVKFDIPLAKDGQKLRMDMDLTEMARNGSAIPPAVSRIVAIRLGDRKVSYTLYPNVNRYMTHSDEKANTGAYQKPIVEKTKVGNEVVDGHRTDKYRVKITYRNGTSEEGFLWNAPDLDGMTIKSEIESDHAVVTSELRSISMKTPSPSLFEIPAGYTEAQGFLDLMAEKK